MASDAMASDAMASDAMGAAGGAAAAGTGSWLSRLAAALGISSGGTVGDDYY
jgi:hypothetical protein